MAEAGQQYEDLLSGSAVRAEQERVTREVCELVLREEFEKLGLNGPGEKESAMRNCRNAEVALMEPARIRS